MTDAELRHTALTLAVSLGSGHGHHDVLAAAQEFYMFLKPTMPVAGAGKGAGGLDDLDAGLGAGQNLRASGVADLPTARMMSVGALRMCELGIAPLLRDAFSDARDIWRAMEAARPKAPGTAHPSDFIYPAKS